MFMLFLYVCIYFYTYMIYSEKLLTNNCCSFWCFYSWPIALVFKCVPVPKKQFVIGRKKHVTRIESKQADTELTGKLLVELIFSCLRLRN